MNFLQKQNFMRALIMAGMDDAEIMLAYLDRLTDIENGDLYDPVNY